MVTTALSQSLIPPPAICCLFSNAQRDFFFPLVVLWNSFDFSHFVVILSFRKQYECTLPFFFFPPLFPLCFYESGICVDKAQLIC